MEALDTAKEIERSGRKYQAIFLQALEKEVPDKEKFKQLRKLYLDSGNNWLREILSFVFGTDFEGRLR